MGTHLRLNVVPLTGPLYETDSDLIFFFFLPPWWGWDAVVLDDDQVLFQNRDLNDRVYYIALFWVFLGPNSGWIY